MGLSFAKQHAVARILIGVAALIIISAGGALALREPSLNAVEKLGVAPVPNVPPAKLDQVAVAAPVPAEATKSDQFILLTKTGNATDAYRAYRLAADCASTQAWETLLKQKPNDLTPGQAHEYMASLPKVEEVCGNLSPGQIASRKQYIVKAALAGVHGAFGSLTYSEGPEGILHLFNDDDEWKTLHLAALEAGLQTADPAALMGKSTFFSNCSQGPDALCKPTQATKAQSITLLVAALDAHAIAQGKPMPRVLDPNRFTPDLPLELAKKAIADGHMLVVNARSPQ